MSVVLGFRLSQKIYTIFRESFYISAKFSTHESVLPTNQKSIFTLVAILDALLEINVETSIKRFI